jgi:hypothetical protein
MDRIIAEILDDNPFPDIGITRSNLEKIDIEGSDSGRVFFINSVRRYKLRACKNEGEAKEIESHVLAVQEITPKLIGRDRSYILMEALEGFRMLTHEDILANAKAIGRLCAIANSRKAEDVDEEERFLRRLSSLLAMNIISQELHDEIAKVFIGLEHARPKEIRLDLDDLHKGNLMINNEGRIYYVDEESIDPRMKGMGLGKILKVVEKREWKEFLEGYADIEDPSIFTPEYVLLIELGEMIRIAEKKSRHGEDAAEELIVLDELLLKLRPLVPLR